MKNVLGYFTAKAAQLPAGEESRLQTISISGGNRYGVQFTSGGSQQCIWTIPRLPETYQGGTIKVDVDCIMASATSGNVVLTAAVEAVTPADALNLNTTLSFDTANSSGNVAVAGTAGYLFIAPITLTLNDSAAQGDYYRVKLVRTTDTATGDLIVLGATIYEDITNTKGDLFVATSNTAIANLPVGTNNYVLTADSTQTAGVKWGSPMVNTTPTIQTFTSGSGTYTTPANCIYIRVRMVGGGGGGGGGGTQATATTGGNGGNTTFGTTLLAANGGGGGGTTGGGGSTGGTASLGTGPIGVAVNGNAGGSFMVMNAQYCSGGNGGASPFGGAGYGVANGAGQAASANSGSGGGSGGSNNNAGLHYGYSGGASGGYIDAMIINPSATYSYAIGAAGSAGAAGTDGFIGGAGGSGYIIVEQYFAVSTLPYVAPTIQTFTSGSGTYTTPTNCLYIRVRMVGGGGGGGGTGTAGQGFGGAGGNTTFGTTLLAANGGGGGYTSINAGIGGSGGTASLGSGPIGTAITGNGGSGISFGANYCNSQSGGGSPLFGGGGAGTYNAAGGSGAANSGGGGGGGSNITTTNGYSGGSGGSGGCVNAIIVNPLATYSYSVGAGGTAGAAGTSGFAGGAGGSGYIIVEQYFAPASAQAYVTPTVTKLTSGSGTYNTPAGCAFIKIKMVGGGGGGGCSGSAGGTAGSAGSATTFGSSLLSAGGGGVGSWQAAGGAGGTSSLGTGPIGTALSGGIGGGYQRVSNTSNTIYSIGGFGGSTAFGGGGGNSYSSGPGSPGTTNTGGGGGGAGGGAVADSSSGSGGGSGGYIEAIISSPQASYSYSVGTGGNGQSAGTSGQAGGAGGSGYIVIEEYCTQASGTYATLTGSEFFTSKRIQYAAGTTAAATAPIKLLSGTNMTTPEVGAIEYDGTNLYLTNSTATRAAVQTSSNTGLRNRVINGDMRISQRSAGAAYNSMAAATVYYAVDRFVFVGSQASKFNSGQNLGSVTPPDGFSNYLGFSVASSYSSLSTDYFFCSYAVEGYDMADLNWGASTAKTVTLSFWARSSIAGNHSVTLQAFGSTRCYPVLYNIASANTWQRISITIAGDTTGTWLKNNGAGVYLCFNLGSGSARAGTSGAWTSSDVSWATGGVSLVGTASATFYITGVQLEAGTYASDFEHRPFATELAMCQRYYEKSYNSGTAIASSPSAGSCSITLGHPTAALGYTYPYKVSKRTTPTLTIYDGAANSGKISYNDGSWKNNGTCSTNSKEHLFYIQANITSASYANFEFSSDAEI